jgi:hypothetical protein
VIEAVKARIKWLRSGTKALFGEMKCSTACIVVDVSDSMDTKLEDVRVRLGDLLKEQV